MLQYIDGPPEQGEDFQAIIDDYQKLIVPGQRTLFIRLPFISITESYEPLAPHRAAALYMPMLVVSGIRSDVLAAPIILCILPDCIDLRGHSWRPLLQQRVESWIQCAFPNVDFQMIHAHFDILCLDSPLRSFLTLNHP